VATDISDCSVGSYIQLPTPNSQKSVQPQRTPSGSSVPALCGSSMFKRTAGGRGIYDRWWRRLAWSRHPI